MKKYKKILWYIIKFLFLHKKRVSSDLNEMGISPNGTKKIVFGNDDFVIEIKICE